ncbi:hypothetical protein MLD38_024962 [Melastoma candidum]|uniref:Uncharacterized protein n=1 Tax=Melastoma candidum TaxID=119954 RepID=A0ACB9NU01_9MYRT|nr:hypothetical protein MLD38_024962 [Melastoma candidum]
MGEGAEVEVGLNGCGGVPVESGSAGKDELKRLRDCFDDGIELYTSPGKRQVKDLPSDKDDCSEVSNPTVYPCGSETQDPSSLTSKLPDDGSVVRCSEVTSKSFILSPKETLSNEGSVGSGNDAEFDSRTDGNESSAKSCVVLEIPKHISTTGIRKITLKLSKKKEDRDDENSSFVRHPYFNRSERDVPDGHIKVEQYGDIHERIGFLHSLCTPNLELKMSKKVIPSSYPTNVKKLLQTGILDGAKIKYISSSKDRHLDGVIKGGGYLCGCSLCNYSKVLSAFEFEQHAGFKSKHPNNRIFLENGKPVYSIIQELKNAPNGILDVVLKDVAGSAINEDGFKAWKETLVHDRGEVEVENSYSSFYHQSRGVEESNCTIEYYAKDNFRRPATLMDEYEPVLKMPGMYSGYSLQPKRIAESSKRSRDNDLHKLLFMPNGLPEGAELGYIIKGQRILGGYKQGNGIVCNCCQKEISPSQFEAHAGMAARRQPYRHIYASNGLNLHDIALSLANGHNLSGSSDDMCSSCGEEGNLILCVQCPRAFHAACLGLDSVPEGDWCCSNCMDKSLPGKKAISGDINTSGRQIFIRLTRVVKEPEYDIGGCCVCRDHDFSTGTFDERTVIICDQCEKEFHVGCLRKIGQCDLSELPSEKWFCCVDCHRIHEALETSVSNGFETVPCSLLNIISRKHREKGLLFGGSGNDIQWRILSGKSRFPEHLPLLSWATAIFRECFDPIVAASGRDLIPVMVYGRNISGQEFGGMYCVVLTVKSIVVSAGLLRIFGKEVAELPMVATCGEFQGKGYFQTLFTRIEGLLHSLNVEKLVLPAAEEAESIWTKRFGFRRMSEENLVKHMKDHQLTIFKGTSMLEKEVSLESSTQADGIPQEASEMRPLFGTPSLGRGNRSVVSRASLARNPSARITLPPYPLSSCYSTLTSPKLFISGLNRLTTDDKLQEAFAPFGKLIEAKVIIDRMSGRSKGFGFVTYETVEEAEQAREGMNAKFLDGWVIFVDPAKPREPRPPPPPPPQQETSDNGFRTNKTVGWCG